MGLTLVIPVYNEQAVIGRCLDHVAAQSRPVDECLIVDNNCTDSTVAIAQSYSDRLPIRIVKEAKPGVLWAREAGFAAASHEVLGRIDADTFIDRHWARRGIGYLDDNPDVVALSGYAYSHDAPFDRRSRSAVRGAAMKAVRARREAPPATTMFGANMMVRKDAWRAARAEQVRAVGTHEDHDLYWAMRGLGMDVRQLPALLAGVSVRRFAMSLRSNLTYAIAGVRTAWLHGQKRVAAAGMAVLPVQMIYVAVLQVLIRPYDPVTGTWRPFRNAWSERMSPVHGEPAGSECSQP
ncbi:glycosyltransferase family 2 protein [Gordonia sp. PDNC005]|uniref:glycosyltransferase family 2 protein n=1 Tax=unclassified Gordonia (in: high G+C Gram-positive bacteria) TaxID=2657482 RepID=UPI001966AEDA|nr:glycosyltransferase family 2 protein [Gordonia sp. PDNC005]QRY61551.1 glycosyltransferase family 2 protein [Gordonia sp. PDNC005]